MFTIGGLPGSVGVRNTLQGKGGLRTPGKFLKCRCKIVSFEATIRIPNNFCANNMGKDLWMAFIHPWGLGLPQCRPQRLHISKTS